MTDRERFSLPSRSELVDVGAVLTMVLVAITTFRSSYGGVAYLVVGLVGAVAGIVVAQLGHRLRWPFVVTAVVAIVAYVVVASATALRHHAIAGFLPGPRSALESLTSAVTGWKELVTTAPPVGSTGDLLVIPVVSAMTAAFAAMTLALRLRFAVLAIVPPMIVLGLGIAVGIDEPVSIVVHGAVFVGLVIAWLAWREHERRPLLEGAGMAGRQLVAAAVVLAVAGLAGFYLAPTLPGAEASNRDIWRQTVTPPFDPRQYPSPLSRYRDYVKPGYDANGDPNDPDVLFTIEGLPEGIPVRLATMDTYDGMVWQVSAGEPGNPSLRDSGSFERIGVSLPADVDGELAEVTVTIGDYRDVWVPDVGEVVSIRFTGSAGGPERDRELTNSFRYNRATDTGATILELQEGDRYEMTVRLPVVLDELAREPIESDAPRIGQVRAVAEIAQVFSTPDIISINDTGERLDRVRELMVTTGAYSDGDDNAGHIKARAGHNAPRLAEFVQGFPSDPLVGNAEQYTSTYSLLFRSFQVPTRVVMGFVPQEPSLDGPVEVLSTDVDAWVEVPVRDRGWVGVFPTPPRDQLSALSTAPQQPEPDYRTQNPPPPPLLDPEFDQPAKASGDAKAPEDENAGDDEGAAPIVDDGTTTTSFLRTPVGIAAGIVLTPALLATLAGGLIVLLKTQRRKRRRQRGAAHDRIANGWREVTDLAVDMGRPVPPTTTRREAAVFVGESTVALADKTDAAVWGGAALSDAEVDAYWDELSQTLDSMKSELGFVDRVRASVSLQSLRRTRSRPTEPRDRARST